jgi:hypothetical protein
MYNRYVRDDGGVYSGVSENGGPSSSQPPRGEKGAEDLIRRILGGFGLGNVDTGDILLLLMLFFLFSEKGDEELMTALGLLFIL